MSFGLARGRTLETAGFGVESADLPAFDAKNRAAARVDPRAWFETPGRTFEIEIGSGKGTFLVQHAPHHPDVNFLGIEWAAPFYKYAADRFRRHALDNARMLRADATEFIHFRCPDAIAQAIHVYFSDPWPKARHHKRRVIQDRTLRDFHRLLTEDGRVHLVTDHDDLWAWYEEHAERNAGTYERRPFEGGTDDGELVGTNYERKFAIEGRNFRGMTLVRR
ncbi:MAG: tRNA (guanosine(46)-N7)-methyltransferase TrmB [Phycisphaerae bacterium]|nr:tRNA (guanosine(46)-N7)-methyltransferase TrmB [Phycisphaerae bacterium]